ncbi:MAG: hypothetical protein NVS4B12_27650 [Ktedonobacteraceae bacterium]
MGRTGKLWGVNHWGGAPDIFFCEAARYGMRVESEQRILSYTGGTISVTPCDKTVC